MASQRSRRHHYLPVFYQKKFAGHDGNVWVYDFESEGSKHLNPRVALAIRDFNTIHTPEGPSDLVEKALSKLDDEAATALRRIEEGFSPVFGDVRRALCLFMAFQATRDPAFREQLDDATNQIVSLMMKAKATRPDSLRRELRAHSGKEPTDDEVMAEAEALRQFGDRFRVANTRDSHIRTTLEIQESGELAYILSRKIWSIEISEGLDFVTSDRPVSLWKCDPAWSEGVGLLTADEVRFPLSPQACLVMRHPWVAAPHRVVVSNERVLELNTHMIQGARRFLVSKFPLSGLEGYEPSAPVGLQVEQLAGPRLASIDQR